MNILNHFFAWLYWNPPRVAFTVPLIDRPVVWYGILFVTGFILGYFIINPIFSRFLTQTEKLSPSEAKRISYSITDKLCWFIVAGTLIGARLGSVIFYDWEIYRENPWEIFQIWKGGLASHGGAVGVLIGLYFFSLYIRRSIPSLTFIKLLDIVAIPTALAACFIRLGNFMNQEILGTVTTMPWAVVFGNASDGSAPMPRHPIQLYEAVAYLATFFILYTLWKKKGDLLPDGSFFGLLMICVFGSRFFLEYWKDTMDSTWDVSFIQMGQLLSVPFILIGVITLIRNGFFQRIKLTSFLKNCCSKKK
jgi:phosphatidylglycerol---prolipoprotein diacylglyceryl transferase